jgi:hypothetical protein
MMRAIEQPYAPRPVRYLGLSKCGHWRIKTYSISAKNERVDPDTVAHIGTLLPAWLANATLYDLPTYRIATLIVHEGREGCFGIISWWIDNNMLQAFVYLATDSEHRDFRLFSDRGVFTCIWEMSVLWFERNAWVEHVLKTPYDPSAFDRYLAAHFNADV